MLYLYLLLNAAAQVGWLVTVYVYFANRPQLVGQELPPRRPAVLAFTSGVMLIITFCPLFIETMSVTEKVVGLPIAAVVGVSGFIAVRGAGEKASRRARVQFERRCNERHESIS